MIGEVIGNFRIVSRLGEGGMGEVFVAEQQQIHTKVAIKMLLAKISENHEIVQRFFNEAIAVSKIQHAGIAKIFDVGFHGARAYLVMELLEGENLSQRIKRGPLSLPEISDLGRQIASVLDAVHKAGITHRDLKPDNIFIVPDAELTRGERIKILDFGIAKLTSAGVGMTSTNASAMGTPLYMSPEQWMSSAKVDWRADAYSLGCVAFEMVTGRPPFSGESIGQLCAAHLNTPAPLVRGFVQVPPQLDALIAQLLEKDPAQRPASMKEVANGFASLLGHGATAGYSHALAAASMPMGSPSASLAAPAAASVHPSMPHAQGGATTLGAAASSAVVPAAPTKSKLVFLLLGVVLVLGAAAGVFFVMQKKEPAKATVAAAAEPPLAATPAPSPAPPTPAVVADAAVAVEPSATPDDAAAEAVAPEPPVTRPDDKPAVEKPAAKPTEKPSTKPTEKPVDKHPATTPPPPEPTPPPAPDPNLPVRLDRPMIKGIIKKLKGQMEVCRTQSSMGGRALVEVTVAPDGKVTNVAFLQVPDPGAAKCVTEKIQQNGAMPATQKGGTWKAMFDLPGKYYGDVVPDRDDAPVRRNR